MVHTMSARLWMDRFLLLHALSLASAFASAFSHGATFGSREMMAPRCECLLLARRDGKDRERRQGRERKEECLGERRKRKAATPKAQTHKSKKQLFSPFSSFLFDFSPFFYFSRNKKQAPKNTQTTHKRWRNKT